jgi:hypothetical protein
MLAKGVLCAEAIDRQPDPMLLPLRSGPAMRLERGQRRPEGLVRGGSYEVWAAQILGGLAGGVVLKLRTTRGADQRSAGIRYAQQRCPLRERRRQDEAIGAVLPGGFSVPSDAMQKPLPSW